MLMNKKETIEPCEDVVSREAVLDKKWELYDSYAGKYIQVVDVGDIEELPSVTLAPKEDKWIPCSKKMPKQNEYVDHVCKYYLIQDEYGDMYIAHYTNVGWIPIESLHAIETKVVAWMPLPKKYKTECVTRKSVTGGANDCNVKRYLENKEKNQ